jgi:N-acetylglucosaminyldiphosphoundecaprenol N-acetyl-beta-D-mannosaminyltransferase
MDRSDRFTLGTISIDRISFAEAVNAIGALAISRRGGYVFTPNVDHVVLAETDLEFRAAYRNATLVLADGKPVHWASYLFDKKLPAKVSGSDLIGPVAAMAAQLRLRLYLFGGRPQVAERTAKMLEQNYPGLHIAGYDSPAVDLESPTSEESLSLERLREAQPDLVLVALGTPKQERWIYRHASDLAPALSIGVGASFDFITGDARRAPPQLSALGLEWLYRFVHEPRRLAYRYFWRDPKFLVIVARQLWHKASARAK